MFCGSNSGRLVTRDEIAETVNASAHHVGHVVSCLAHMGLLHTVRGRSGGLALALPMDKINIGHVFKEMESDLPIAECFDPETNTCPLADVCLLRDAIQDASAAFYARLDQVTLAQIVENNTPLLDMMCQNPIGCSRNTA